MYAIENKEQPNVGEEKHEHKWRVVFHHWQCEICEKTFGLQ